MKISRRAFLGGAAAGAALVGTGGLARASATRRPRVLVQFHLAGGIDAILSTDPKSQGEYADEVDRPYDESEIRTVGGSRVGPLLAGLERHLPRMAILNGVNVATVSHETGRKQLFGMRRLASTPTAYGFHGTLGRALGVDTPLWDVRFVTGTEAMIYPSGRSLVIADPSTERGGTTRESLLVSLSRLAQDRGRREIVADALGRELARCNPGEDCAPLDTARALLRKLPDVPLPAVTPIPDDGVTLGFPRMPGSARGALKIWGEIFRDAFFLLEHRLCASLFIEGRELWDTHAWNWDRQRVRMRSFAPALAYFLDELQRRRTTDGAVLADEVGVLVSSELGRYPIKNFHAGKDHLPEMPAVLIGPGIRPGQYGATDRYLMAQPIAPSTGLLATGAAAIAPTLDDVGATVLAWFGIAERAPLGYWGRPLEFMLS